MSVQDCRSCRHFFDVNQAVGTCRRYPHYQNRSPNEICGEFAEKAISPDFAESGVFSHIERQLIELPVLVEPPKRKGRPRKND